MGATSLIEHMSRPSELCLRAPLAGNNTTHFIYIEIFLVRSRLGGENFSILYDIYNRHMKNRPAAAGAVLQTAL